jgi:hypothetical protein
MGYELLLSPGICPETVYLAVFNCRTRVYASTAARGEALVDALLRQKGSTE